MHGGRTSFFEFYQSVWLSMILCIALSLNGVASAQSRGLGDGSDVNSSPIDVFAAGLPDYGGGDGSPMGVDLAGVRLFGPGDVVIEQPPAGFTMGSVPNAPARQIERRLLPFLGQPLSMRLIGEIQSAISAAYQVEGFAFVSVTAPPQEITHGVLQLQVLEFYLDRLVTTDSKAYDAAWQSRRLRARPGERIDARALAEDLDWLNRNPYRQVQARFAPGASVGVTDLTLLLTTRRLWQLHAGWRNADAAAGIGHYFIHAGVGLPRLADATASYQLTANQGVPFSQPDQRPSHVAHSGRLSLSPWPRQSIEFSASTSTTRSAPSGFLHMDSETQAFELSYRTALSNVIARAYLGDLVAGVERKRMNRRTYFNGVFVGEGSASLLQPYLGWEHVSMLLGGRTQFAARLHINQEGGVAGNDADSWDAFTNGRVTDVNYVYGTLNINRSTPLQGGLTFRSQLDATIAGVALPDPEQLTLGGQSGVRGYGGGDATVDVGAVFRNEVRFPTVTAAAPPRESEENRLIDDFSLYTLVDAGFGQSLHDGKWILLASVGAGFDLRVSNWAFVQAVAAQAITDAGETSLGDWRIGVSVTLSF